MFTLITKCVSVSLCSKRLCIISSPRLLTTLLVDEAQNRSQVLQSFASSFNSEHIHFLPSGGIQQRDGRSNHRHNNTLVVLCGWLDASEKNLNKYVGLWHREGVDVLRVKTHWMDLFLPTLTMERNAAKVTDSLSQVVSAQIYPNIVFHTFCSGAYFYASVVNSMETKGVSRPLTGAVRAVIFDSLVNWFHVLTSEAALCAMARAIVPSHDMMPVVKLVELLTDHPEHHSRFLHVDHFHRLNEVIRANALHLPTLLLYSRTDPFVDVTELRAIENEWRANRLVVDSHCWTDVPHVQLYKLHSQQYTQKIQQFLGRSVVTSNELLTLSMD